MTETMAKNYTEVEVRIFHWREDGRGRWNALRLGKTFAARGYDVKYVNEISLGVKMGQKEKENNDAAWEWFRDWVADEEELVSDKVENQHDHKLLMFYYIGHGSQNPASGNGVLGFYDLHARYTNYW